jgi:alkylation response protein AidB-like acyl-CoA dehydrogenase
VCGQAARKRAKAGSSGQYIGVVVEVIIDVRFIRTEETKIPDEKQAIVAKSFCSETAVEIVSEAMQLLGGVGYMRHSRVEKIYRDIRLNAIYEGENSYLAVLLGEMLGETARDAAA